MKSPNPRINSDYREQPLTSGRDIRTGLALRELKSFLALDNLVSAPAFPQIYYQRFEERNPRQAVDHHLPVLVGTFPDMSDSEGDGGGVPLLERLSRSASPESKGLKRKRVPATTESKKSKRRKTKKPQDIIDEDLNEELGINVVFAKMDPGLLADHVAQRTKRFSPHFSLIELEDRYIPAKAIADTTDWEEQRTTDNLPAFLENLVKEGLTSVPKAKGAPHTLVITGAGLRAADLVRALRKFQSKDASVAKLFAKHIKLKEAMDSCKKLKMNIGVGTPQRISDLLDNGALSPGNLRRIIIDASHIDQKKRGIMDMKEIHMPLVQLLSRPDFKSRYGASGNGIQLVFY